MNRMVEWTEEKLRFLRENYPTRPSHEIAEVVGCSDSTVRIKARELGIEKSPEFRRSAFIGRYVKRDDPKPRRQD